MGIICSPAFHSEISFADENSLKHIDLLLKDTSNDSLSWPAPSGNNLPAGHGVLVEGGHNNSTFDIKKCWSNHTL